MSIRSEVPLVAFVRVAAASVVCAAFAVDVVLLGDPTGGDGTRAWLLFTCVLALIGVVVVARPTDAVVLGAVGAMMSALQSIDIWRDSVRLTFFVDVAVLPLLFGLLVARRGRGAWMVAGLVGLAGSMIWLRSPAASTRWILGLIMVIGFGFAATAVAYVRIKDRERRTSVDLARRDERLDLARELHDVVGHHVTGIIVLAQARRFTLAAGAPDVAEDGTLDEVLRDIEAAGHETMSSVRCLVGMLRSDESAPVTALSDVESLVDDLRASHPATILDVDSSLRDDWIRPDIATTVYQVMREAVTNVRRHGDLNRPVECSIRRSGDAIVVTVENTMLDEPGDRGFGVIGMRERIQVIGGTFSAGVVGAGLWRLDVSVPLDAARVR